MHTDMINYKLLKFNLLILIYYHSTPIQFCISGNTFLNIYSYVLFVNFLELFLKVFHQFSIRNSKISLRKTHNNIYIQNFYSLNLMTTLIRIFGCSMNLKLFLQTLIFFINHEINHWSKVQLHLLYPFSKVCCAEI